MILLYFLLVFVGVMALNHYLSLLKHSRHGEQSYQDRPLQALIEHCQQSHTHSLIPPSGIAKKG